MGVERASKEYGAAINNLAKLHRYMKIYISDKISPVRPQYVTSGHTTKSLNVMRANSAEDEDYDATLAACVEWPIMQHNVSWKRWMKMMDRIVAVNYRDFDKHEGCMSVSFDFFKSAYSDAVEKNKKGVYQYKSVFMCGEPLGQVIVKDMNDEQLDEVKNWPLQFAFPDKVHDETFSKQNVYVKDVLETLKKADPKYYETVVDEVPYLIGLASDQVCCTVMSHYAHHLKGWVVPLRKYRALLYNQELSKAVSDFAKICGVALNPFLGPFAEMDALRGRGSLPANPQQELDELSGVAIPQGHNVLFDDGVIKREAMKLFEEAMPELAMLPAESRWERAAMPVDMYWKKRTQHCVNGSHHMPRHMKNSDPTKGMSGVTRMVYLENETVNPMYATTPLIDATLSWKNENPKVRALKSEDTVGYLNEDYIMKAVEKAWTHKEVLIDPGMPTKQDECKRISEMDGKVYVMLDYSAMDKQHSLKSQDEVLEALLDFLGAPEYIKKWMLSANKNQFLTYANRTIKLVYSLLTGRRMTTFFNTVLNYVYLKIALRGLRPTSALYAGDDICLRFNSVRDARVALQHAISSKSVFNPRKQSWGLGAEFLRTAVMGNRAYGYVNRTIASTVCGSWVNVLRLAENHLFGLFARYAWMLDNRLREHGFAANLLTNSMWKRTQMSKQMCKRILRHEVSVDGSPVCGNMPAVTVMRPRIEVLLKSEMKDVKPGKGAAQIVFDFQQALGENRLPTREAKELTSILTKASYMKSLIKGYNSKEVTYEVKPVCANLTNYTEYLLAKANKGILMKHPTLPAVQGLISLSALRRLFEFTAELEKDMRLTDREWLFGNDSYPVVTVLGSDYDDGLMLSKISDFKEATRIARIKFAMRCFT